MKNPILNRMILTGGICALTALPFVYAQDPPSTTVTSAGAEPAATGAARAPVTRVEPPVGGTVSAGRGAPLTVQTQTQSGEAIKAEAGFGTVAPPLDPQSPPYTPGETALGGGSTLRTIQTTEQQTGAVGAVPEKLEDALEAALRNNPDLLLAQANVRAAEAQLNKVRLEVVRDVSQSYRARQNLKESVALIEKQARAGMVDSGSLTETKMRQAELDAKLQYLVGLRAQPINQFYFSPAPGMMGTVGAMPKEMGVVISRPELGQLSLPYAEKLNAKVSIEFTDSPISSVCDFLQAQYDLNVVADPEMASMKISRISAKDIPLVQALQVLVDSCQAGVCIVFRDYGVLITSIQRASTISAPTLPPNLPLYATGGGRRTVEMRLPDPAAPARQR